MKAPELCDKRFPDVKFLIPGLIPEGVTLLVSRPKLGKSWLLQQIAASIALGTTTLASDPRVSPVQGDVLHLTLEDGERRFQRRLKKHFGSLRSNWPARMTIVPKWRRLDQGGIEDIRDWCRSVQNPTLVNIDTLKKVRPAAKASESSYATDYEANEKLVQLTHEFPGLGIIVAHHDRKMDADDPFDTISGTLGLTGGVDTIALMKRHRQGVTLHVQGRDLLDSVEKAVNFDRETCRWMILGEATEVHRSKDERLVIEALRAAGSDGLKVEIIMEETGLRPRNKVDLLLGRMAKNGLIERVKRGLCDGSRSGCVTNALQAPCYGTSTATIHSLFARSFDQIPWYRLPVQRVPRTKGRLHEGRLPCRPPLVAACGRCAAGGRHGIF